MVVVVVVVVEVVVVVRVRLSPVVAAAVAALPARRQCGRCGRRAGRGGGCAGRGARHERKLPRVLWVRVRVRGVQVHVLRGATVTGLTQWVWVPRSAGGGHKGGVSQARARPPAGQLGVMWAPGPRLACHLVAARAVAPRGKTSARVAVRTAAFWFCQYALNTQPGTCHIIPCAHPEQTAHAGP